VPSGGAYPLTAAQLDGVNIWLLEHIAAIGGASFSYSSVALPEPLASSGDRGAQLAYLFSAAAPGGAFDCVVSATPLRDDVLAVADTLLPVETSSLTAVVPYNSPLSAAPTLSVLFAWTNPFSFEIWLLVAFSLVFGALVMYVFEGNERYEDYGAHDLALPLRLCRGCYKAFCNFACIGGFTPNTPASQTFNVAFSFSMLLLQATYTANLAAYFASGTKTSGAAVTDLSSFAAAGLSACVGNDPHTLALLRAAYPATRFVALPSGVTAHLLAAIAAGTCGGGVAPGLELRYALGPQDAARAYCDIEMTGARLSQITYGIPFNRATVNGTIMAALNTLAAAAYAYGDYAVQASAPTFPSPSARGTCISGASGLADITGISALTITQVSGIFFLLLFGAVMAGITFAVFHWQAVRAGEAGSEGGKEGGDEDAREIRAKLVTKEEAVAALCGVLAREAVAALDVPARVRAATDASLGERGAALRITLQLRDVGGRAYGRRFEAELPHASDWRYLYTRLHPDDAARFARTLRSLAAGKPRPAGGNEDEEEEEEEEAERGALGQPPRGSDGLSRRRGVAAQSPAPSVYDEEAGGGGGGVPTLQRASGWAYNTPVPATTGAGLPPRKSLAASRQQLAALWEPASATPSAAPSGTAYKQTHNAPFAFPSLRSFAGFFMPPQNADSSASLQQQPAAAAAARQPRAGRTGRADAAWAAGSVGGVSFARGGAADDDDGEEDDAARRRALRGSLSVGALSRSRSYAPAGGGADDAVTAASVRRAASSVGAGARSRGGSADDDGGGARSFRRAASAVGGGDSSSRVPRSSTRGVEADSGAPPPQRSMRRGKSQVRIPSFND
jgi:hypothetical protein